MKIDVIEVIEEDNGSVILTLEADKEAKELLMELGLNRLLLDGVYRFEEIPDENSV